MATVAVLGTLDTKGTEIGFLAEQVRRNGCEALVIDLGILEPPTFEPDVSREAVAAMAGESARSLAKDGDRGQAVDAMTRGIERLVPKLYGAGRIQAVVGMGGSAGTTMATAAMRALPMGLPKVMVSTVAGGDVAAFVGAMDITMIPSIVDISGLNRISRQVIVQAAAAVSAMTLARVPDSDDRPLIAASMFGNTTGCVEAARARLESEGYEVLVFHATGAGGRASVGCRSRPGRIREALDRGPEKTPPSRARGLAGLFAEAQAQGADERALDRPGRAQKRRGQKAHAAGRQALVPGQDAGGADRVSPRPAR